MVLLWHSPFKLGERVWWWRLLLPGPAGTPLQVYNINLTTIHGVSSERKLSRKLTLRMEANRSGMLWQINKICGNFGKNGEFFFTKQIDAKFLWKTNFLFFSTRGKRKILNFCAIISPFSWNPYYTHCISYLVRLHFFHKMCWVDSKNKLL